MCFLSPQLKFSESVPASYYSKVVLKSFPSPFSLFSVRLLLHPFSVLCLLKRFHFSSVVLYFCKGFVFLCVRFLLRLTLSLFVLQNLKKDVSESSYTESSYRYAFSKRFRFSSFRVLCFGKGFVFPQLWFKRFHFSSVRIQKVSFFLS